MGDGRANFIDGFHHVVGLGLEVRIFMFEGGTGAVLSKNHANRHRLVTAGKVNQIDTHVNQRSKVVRTADARSPQQRSGETMFESDDGRREFSWLAGELDGIGQNHNFGRKSGVGEGGVVVHTLPRDGQEFACALRFTSVGVLERRGQDVTDGDAVIWEDFRKLWR